MPGLTRLFRFIACIVLLPLLLAACAQTGSVPVKSVMNEKGYVLDSGDMLRIVVFGQEELSGEFAIDPSGSISLPLIQEIQAAGLTRSELEKAITERLEPKYLKDPKVSVQILEFRSVYILGEVRTPGKYPYVPNMTVLQAVAVAGGHTYRANEKAAKITRMEGDILKTLTLRPTDMISPGDTVVIDRRWF